MIKAFYLVLLICFGILISSCSADMSGPVYKRVSQWESGSGFGSSVDVIQHDFGNVNQAFLKQNFPSAKTFCVVLGNDVQDANGNLPTPSVTVTLALADAYTDLYNGAIKCYDDASASNDGKLSNDINLMKQGLQKIQLAQSEIKTIEKNKIS